MGAKELTRTWVVAVVVLSAAAATAVAASKPMPSFAGEWRFDAAKSDVPSGGPHGGGMGGPPMGSGGWGGAGSHGGHREHGHDGPGGGAGGAGDSARGGHGGKMRMPEDMRIEQKPGLLRLEDSTGIVFREIAFNDSAATSATTGPGEFFGGRWAGDRLEVEHSTPNGATVVESYALADHGQTLVIKVSMAAESGSPREMKRVYRKVETP